MIFQKLIAFLNFISPPFNSQRQVYSIYVDAVSHNSLLYKFAVFCFSETYIKYLRIYFSCSQYSVLFFDTI